MVVDMKTNKEKGQLLNEYSERLYPSAAEGRKGYSIIIITYKAYDNCIEINEHMVSDWNSSYDEYKNKIIWK